MGIRVTILPVCIVQHGTMLFFLVQVVLRMAVKMSLYYVSQKWVFSHNLKQLKPMLIVFDAQYHDIPRL